jgi:hypothetical protein
MSDLLNIGAVSFLLLAILASALNWAALVVSVRNKKRGIDRHLSTIPIAAQIFGVAAAVSSHFNPAAVIPSWICLLPALLDVSLCSLAYLPVYLLRRRSSRA